MSPAPGARRPLSYRLRCGAAALLIAGAAALPLHAAGAHTGEGGASGETILRDTEIENDIRALATPVWRAAGLEPGTMGIYIVNDAQLNSFVAGGQAIFLNSGLILRARTPNMLIGVIAHESGHIVGGHVLRSLEALKNASIETIIATVLAVGASVAGGNSGPMIAAAGLGQRAFMSFSVAQEATADHMAMSFLDRSGESARGLLEFFEILQADEPVIRQPIDPWARTHPLTSERIDYLRHHVETARSSSAPEPAGFTGLLQAIQVKLHAFLDDPATTLRDYPVSDRSTLARYARAIALYRIPRLDAALAEIDGLIRDDPANPYYDELKGQMLFENGRIREAIGPYELAVKLAPRAALIRIALSQAYIESGNPALNKRAIAYLNDASREEGREGTLWRLLATAYGRDNQLGMMALSLAEGALADNKKKDAQQQAQRAKQTLPRNSVGYQRAEEIQREADHLDDD
ncbi:MAG: M48 family metalloprotease [Alphaproteobacteria bacterium]|nr:M48 family metalloprotease [Alphaproteobacteria bacterium]